VIYHDLWRRSFPPGLEQGQVLFGAVMERPLRILLRYLEDVGKSDPAGDELPGEVILEADEEIERLDSWLNGLPVGRLCRAPTRPFGFGTVAVSFLLGWWIGGD
jgi:hypothetical protein